MTASDTNPPDEVILHRMVWHPDAFDDGKLTSSAAFPSRDLNGVRFVSVDRHDLFDQVGTLERAALQQERADGIIHIRNEVWIADFPCGPIRLIVDDTNSRPLQVTSEEEEFNPAHCGIWNTSGKQGKAYINMLRAKLMKLKLHEWRLTAS